MSWPFRSRRASDPPPPDDDEEYVVLIDERLDPRLVVYHLPDSMQAEQYRGFRTNLRAMNPGDGPRSLLFTSAEAGVGKSVSMANIALALAEVASLEVCIVDADVRAGGQSRLFGTTRAPGLADLMLDKLPPGRVVRPTALPNLSIITAGRSTEGAADVLTSGYMAELIGWLKRRFQYVLVDSPPALLFSDAAELSADCDGVILVVALAETRRNDADLAMQQLQRAGAVVVGSFVTGVSSEGEDVYGEVPGASIED